MQGLSRVVFSIISCLVCCLALALCFNTSVWADITKGLPDNYPSSRSGVDSRIMPWRAIGQLNMAGRGACTATLVGPDLIVTAAHCLWNKDTERWFPPEYVHFVAGFSGEQYQAHSLAKALHINPAFDPRAESRLQSSGNDWALVRLAQAVGTQLGFLSVSTLSEVESFVSSQDTLDQHLLQAGYRFDRSYVLTVNHNCSLATSESMRLESMGVIGHFCDTTQGDSGGPLLLKMDDRVAVLGVYVGRVQMSNMGLVVKSSQWQATLDRLLSQ